MLMISPRGVRVRVSDDKVEHLIEIGYSPLHRTDEPVVFTDLEPDDAPEPDEDPVLLDVPAPTAQPRRGRPRKTPEPGV